jgi:hypothetical protein
MDWSSQGAGFCGDFHTYAAGIGNGYAANPFTARPEAQAVVIHAPGGARIACADLE